MADCLCTYLPGGGTPRDLPLACSAQAICQDQPRYHKQPAVACDLTCGEGALARRVERAALFLAAADRHVLADAIDRKRPATVITSNVSVIPSSMSNGRLLVDLPVPAGGEPRPTRARIKLCGRGPRRRLPGRLHRAASAPAPGRLTTARSYGGPATAAPCWCSLARPCTQV